MKELLILNSLKFAFMKDYDTFGIDFSFTFSDEKNNFFCHIVACNNKSHLLQKV